jgi:hypothetical protein
MRLAFELHKKTVRSLPSTFARHTEFVTEPFSSKVPSAAGAKKVKGAAIFLCHSLNALADPLQIGAFIEYHPPADAEAKAAGAGKGYRWAR